MRWGFPQFTGSRVIINARSKTALEKPTFKRLLLERRCVAQSTGFYEWKQNRGGKKVKYLIRLSNNRMLYFVGSVNTFKDTTGTEFEDLAILTTGANESMPAIHDRISANINQAHC